MLLHAPPIKPMLAKPANTALAGFHVREDQTTDTSQDWAFEPKWDGFRCLIFRDGADVIVQGRSGDDLAYCFPEIVAACQTLPDQIILDGELIILEAGRLQFERLGQRIRPRSEAGGWKIAEMQKEFPADFVAFDILQSGRSDLMSSPYSERRARLNQIELTPPLHRSPASESPAEALDWFHRLEGAGLDGVIAKRLADPYQPGKRSMLKFKHVRTADVVVAGWRPHKSPGTQGQAVVGSLLLGLYDDSGVLHHVGVASGFSASRREELTGFLAPLTLGSHESHPWLSAHSGDGDQRRPGGQSRWTGKKDLSFHLLRLELVAEVKYDHMEGSRFRHVTRLQRFRPDRTPQSCQFSQLDDVVRTDITGFLPSLAH